MKVIYDSTGEIIATDLTPIDTSKTISDTLYPMDVTVAEGKVIDHVDVSVIPHVAVFVDAPKSEQEMTIEQIKTTVPVLLKMDKNHTQSITEMQITIKGLVQLANELKSKIGSDK